MSPYDISFAASSAASSSLSGATEVGGGFGIGQHGAGSVNYDQSQNKAVPWGILAIAAAIVIVVWLLGKD